MNEFKQFEVSKQDFRAYLHKVYDLLEDSGVEMKFLKTREQLDKLDRYGANVIAAKRVEGVAFGLSIAIDGWAIVTDMGLDASLDSSRGLRDRPDIVVKTFLHIIQRKVGAVIFARSVDEIEQKIMASKHRLVAAQYYTIKDGALELVCTVFCTLMSKGEHNHPKRMYAFEIDEVFTVAPEAVASPDSDVIEFLRSCNFPYRLDVGPPVAKRDLTEVADTKEVKLEFSVETRTT